MKMYKIHVFNHYTGKEWQEYGFSRHIMKRIYFLMNDAGIEFGYPNEIVWFNKLVCNFKTFKKCWKKEVVILKKGVDK